MIRMRYGILIVILCRLQSTVAAPYPGCENCGCCVDQVCADAYVQSETKSDVCTYGCIDGIGGNKCYNKCPDDCVTCEQTVNKNCATCEVGKYLTTEKRCVDCPAQCMSCTSSWSCQECNGPYYMGQSTDCSLKCPDNCKTCTSLTHCLECISPYYNQGDTKDCSSSCPGNCFCLSPGLCSSCQDGYYKVEEDCMSACSDTCIACSNQNYCQSCRDGYYNGIESLTNNTVTDCSLQCRDSCSRCTSYDVCTLCTKGQYGSYCQHKCSGGCIYGECNIEDGSCECKIGFAGSTCNECATGRHGDQCENHCSGTCNGMVCKRDTGHCVECKSLNIIGDLCEMCADGMWGTDCSSTCPKHCEGQCLRNSGYCRSCQGNFQGNICNDCSSGYHGEMCNKNCPEQCYESICHTSNGTCKSCNNNYAGQTCEECAAGLHGPACDVPCLSLLCSKNMCNRETGDCTSCPGGLYGFQCEFNCSLGCNGNECDFESGACFECRKPYTGDKCCVEGGHCQDCSSNTVCETCENGYFGKMCDIPCSKDCATVQGPKCEKTDGKCLRCLDGFHGDHCNETCSERCSNNRCIKCNGHCVDGCTGDFEGPMCEQALNAPNTIVPAAVGGAAGAVIVIAAFIVVIIVIRRRRAHADSRKDSMKGTKNNATRLPGPSSRRHDDNKTIYANDDSALAELEYDIDAVDGEEIVIDIPERQNDVYENVHTAPVAELDAFVRRKSEEDYKGEFEQLPKGLIHSHTESRKPENVIKNRYNGIYPYDHSRVKIKGDPKFFINACFIDGFEQKNKYIASLGPTAKATLKFNTFWTMVWHMDSDVIVMLTNLSEQSGDKCEQYWPDLDSTNVHQDITVSCQSVEVFAEYTVRTLTIGKKSKKRTVIQFHYTAWPDKSIPDEVTSLVEFRQRVRSAPRVQQGPVIIHCSAGIGRTGTYIALDRLTEAGEAGERINVYDCVNQMRQQRVNMVQTLEQYQFLHKALVHTLTFQCGAIRSEEFESYIRATSDSEFNANFKLLKTVIEDETVEETQARNKNGRHRDKNRKYSDIPGDRHRPRIHICRTFNSSDYINAIYVNGFKKKDQFIIAQSPLPETVADFLCLIFQDSCYCVVSMENAELLGTEIGDYLGADNQVLRVGTFTVKASRGESKTNYVMRKLTISNSDKHSSGEKTVYHYQLTNWNRDEQVPADVGVFTQFVKDVSNKASEMKNVNAPILVHCLDGAKRSGLFSAVGILLEKVEAEGQVSVPNTLRQLRTRRKMTIPNKEQFEFCFRSVEAHVNSNNVYSNFAR